MRDSSPHLSEKKRPEPRPGLASRCTLHSPWVFSGLPMDVGVSCTSDPADPGGVSDPGHSLRSAASVLLHRPAHDHERPTGLMGQLSRSPLPYPTHPRSCQLCHHRRRRAAGLGHPDLRPLSAHLSTAASALPPAALENFHKETERKRGVHVFIWTQTLFTVRPRRPHSPPPHSGHRLSRPLLAAAVLPRR